MRERTWHLFIIAHIQSGQVNFNQAAGVEPGPARSSHELNGSRASYGATARLSLWIADDAPDTLSAASIFIWTRRAANAASLVLVLPVRMRSPIWNCHSQMSGSTVAATLYRMPL
jgi:hypothetical protein